MPCRANAIKNEWLSTATPRLARSFAERTQRLRRGNAEKSGLTLRPADCGGLFQFEFLHLIPERIPTDVE